MSRCVIVGGSDINNPDYIKSMLHEDDYYIFCDSGLRHAETLGVSPDLITGDFDSHPVPETDTETIVLPREKDDTDTFYAAKEAVRRGYKDFLLLGITGKRLDHTLGNISLLLYLNREGRHAIAADDYCIMEIAGSNPVLIDDSFAFFSVISVDGSADGVYITNAKYPLSGASIKPDMQYAVSNEVLTGKTAEVYAEKGSLLVLKDFAG